MSCLIFGLVWKPKQARICARQISTVFENCCWSFASHQGEFLKSFPDQNQAKAWKGNLNLERQRLSAVCLMFRSIDTSKNWHLMATMSPCFHVLFNQYSQYSCEIRLFNPLSRWGNWESDTDLLEDIWLQKFGGAGVNPGWLNSNIYIFLVYPAPLRMASPVIFLICKEWRGHVHDSLLLKPYLH